MDRLYPLTVTTPANTPLATPVSTPFPLDDAYLEYVHIIVPSGCAGLVGIRILWAGTQVIPWNNNYWLTPDGEKIEVEFQEYMTATGLTILTYNTDAFQHNVYFRALIKLAPLPGEPGFNVTSSSLALPSDSGATGINGISTLTAPVDTSSLVIAGELDQSGLVPVDTSGLGGADQIGNITDVGITDITLTEPPITTTPNAPEPPIPASTPSLPSAEPGPLKIKPGIRPLPPIKGSRFTHRHTMVAHRRK